jgi:hypothetical protein
VESGARFFLDSWSVLCAVREDDFDFVAQYGVLNRKPSELYLALFNSK